MNVEILAQLKTRMASQPRSLAELHRTAVAAGSTWSDAQVGLLLACLPEVVCEGDAFRLGAGGGSNPLVEALLAVATDRATPAAALVARLPRGVLATPAALCETARCHPAYFELVPPNRIRRR